jgi:hypothetical protein
MIFTKQRLEVQKRLSEAISRKMTDNAMAKRKRTKRQTMTYYKTMHRKLKIGQREPH